MSSTIGNYYPGINYNSGAPNGSKFGAISGNGNHPMNDVNWYEAARFANWMNNGQGNASTETGAYTLLGGTPMPHNFYDITRNPGATVFLPSEDEWYKAAYYNAGTNSYYQYPTSSNAQPYRSYPTATPNSANFPDSLPRRSRQPNRCRRTVALQAPMVHSIWQVTFGSGMIR